MAKCVQFNRKHGGHVARVSDQEAEQAVRERHADYCPKHWWKAALAKEALEIGGRE